MSGSRRMRERRWLDLDDVEAAVKVARVLGVSKVAAGRGGFAEAFRRAGGGPAALGYHKTGQSWRDRRNGFVARHVAQAANGEPMWRNGAPTRRHLALAVWAYSPTPARLRRWLAG